MTATTLRYTAVVPPRLAERPTTTVYVRRRLMAGAALFAVVAVLFLGAGSVLANRGGAPASTSTVRPATYVVQPGDTMWSIAAAHHGPAAQTDYLEALIQTHGGTELQIGERITLPSN